MGEVICYIWVQWQTADQLEDLGGRQDELYLIWKCWIELS